MFKSQSLEDREFNAQTSKVKGKKSLTGNNV